jgi:hypothetical protein
LFIPIRSTVQRRRTTQSRLAVVWAVRLFRPQLYGRAFTIVMDHAAQYEFKARTNPAEKLHRWALIIQGHAVKILYRPGNPNVAANVLSRAPGTVLAVVGRLNPHLAAAPVTSSADETELKTLAVVAGVPEKRSTWQLTRAAIRIAAKEAH